MAHSARKLAGQHHDDSGQRREDPKLRCNKQEIDDSKP